MREAKVGDFYHLGHPAEKDIFVAPVELAGLTRGKHQRNKSALAGTRTLCLPFLYETLDAVVGAGVALSLQIFE